MDSKKELEPSQDAVKFDLMYDYSKKSVGDFVKEALEKIIGDTHRITIGYHGEGSFLVKVQGRDNLKKIEENILGEGGAAEQGNPNHKKRTDMYLQTYRIPLGKIATMLIRLQQKSGVPVEKFNLTTNPSTNPSPAAPNPPRPKLDSTKQPTDPNVFFNPDSPLKVNKKDESITPNPLTPGKSSSGKS